MTREEKLNAIAQRCRELLALAESRTPGKWKANDNEVVQLFRGHLQNHLLDTEEERDAAFIAACAGAAEAGWRATLAAIDFMDRIGAMMGLIGAEQEMCDAIITAWEGQY